MKFVLLLEEDGYQIRYWDEINNVVGECIAEDWDLKKLYNNLKIKGFNIQKKELQEAITTIDNDPFVILSSHKSETSLDNFINSLFTIEK